MHTRSERHNGFNLPSMRKLWKTMGEYDALVEYNECAVQHFLLKWDEYKKNGISHAEFINTQAEEVGIHLGYLDYGKYRNDVYLWYLIHPYGCIDTFITDFKKDLKELGFNLKSDYPNKSALEKLIAGMNDAGIAVSVEDYKLDMDTYYRRSRNLFAHKLDNKEKEKVEQLYASLQKDKIFAWYPSLSEALSAPCQYSFADFTLCTANLKNITDTLTTDVYNAIDWNEFSFKKDYVAKDGESRSSFEEKLGKYLQNEKRLKAAIRTYIQTLYGITLPEDKLSILSKKIKGSSNNG